MQSSFFDDVEEEDIDSEYDEVIPTITHPVPSDYQWLLATIEDLCNAAKKNLIVSIQ